MKYIDIEVFRGKMEMPSHDKIILQMLFGAFYGTSRIYCPRNIKINIEFSKIAISILKIQLIRFPVLIKCWIISSSFWFRSTRDRSQDRTSFSFVMLQTEFINFCISRNEIRFLDIGLWVYFFYRSDLFRRFPNTKFKFLPNANCAMAHFKLYSEKNQTMFFGRIEFSKSIREIRNFRKILSLNSILTWKFWKFPENCLFPENSLKILKENFQKIFRV